MKLTRILTIAAALVAIALPTSAMAAKGKGKKARNPVKQASAAALSAHDKNADGVITGDESVALRADFAAAKTGPLAALDVNTDGTLDDNEIAAIHKGKGEDGKGKKKGGKKNKNV